MKKQLLVLLLSGLPGLAFAQQTDSLQQQLPQQKTFTGAVTVTNNGISLIPTFNLGRPAAIFDVTARRGRFSFEPQLTFALENAKPWFFIFWVRYKAIETPKFSMNVGVHPSVVFTNTVLPPGGPTGEALTAVRYFVGELAPTYHLSKRASLGMYYLHSRGFSGAPRATNFMSLTGNFSQIPLVNGAELRIAPQLYLVTIDALKGYYATSAFTLTRNRFPLAVSAIVNQKIQSTIPSDDFIWNVSLTYAY
ncbi:hypothetical protein HNV11_15945 [Spirosoma taeanense]|uniref:Uncharacterized protein n=1 Tax=Spirosoma taeanense TaxID=2735870 RepID=A0A6M5Y9X8_9BACT|nr:hypothetical protein [Spirosoma taeanense]QJW90765.1 hypothetical protein HNV11_15945 [Spirosoma taeanense]